MDKSLPALIELHYLPSVVFFHCSLPITRKYGSSNAKTIRKVATETAAILLVLMAY
jgi:hypothetical protein